MIFPLLHSSFLRNVSPRTFFSHYRHSPHIASNVIPRFSQCNGHGPMTRDIQMNGAVASGPAWAHILRLSIVNGKMAVCNAENYAWFATVSLPIPSSLILQGNSKQITSDFGTRLGTLLDREMQEVLYGANQG